MAKNPFKEVLIIGRPNVPGVPETLALLKTHLVKHGIKVHIEAKTAEFMDTSDTTVCVEKSLNPDIELIIVVGGDGSLLNAAHIAIKYNLPIIGVHRGRLGFLTDIHPDHLEMIDDVLAGNYKEEHRSLIQAKLHQQEQVIKNIALNDVVLMPSNPPQMIEFETHIDDAFVCKQRADGLIIATPTGSTAYALSSGGPILKPKLQALSIVPICPHTLSSRPLVVGLDCRIDIRISDSNTKAVNVSCDGIEHISIHSGDRIIITEYAKKLRLIHPDSYDYFTMLREKLGWQKHAERT